MNAAGVEDKDKVRIKIKVIPRAKKNQISGFMDDGSLKVRLTAPPVDGKANRALIKLLVDNLNISQANISIISGLQGRNKILEINGLSLAEFHTRINQLAG